jgi:predicted DsbA family dithiol-disulfide isomerase
MSTAAPTPIRIDIVSDVVCPWCIVGYKRLERALEAMGDEVRAEVHWHPFELNPQMEAGGENLREHLAAKYGTTAEDSARVRAHLTELGASLDFSFAFSDDMKMFNTFKAHQLLHYAREQGKEHALKLRLFAAFFTEHEAVDEDDVLVRQAEAVGLDADEARAVLSDGRFVEAVRAEQQTWMARGIRAVPTFVFNESLAVSGAQEEALLQQAIRQAL